MILWATNEDVAGYTMRFHSSETSNSNDRPYLVVVWSQTFKAVYFLKDHLGSIRATVLDSAGAPVIGYNDYDPWGCPLALRTKPIPNAYLQGASKNKFTGKEYDDELGLKWYHFDVGRKYIPDIARWATPDPALRDKLPNELVKTQDGKLLSTSPYGYAYDNPLRYTDPDGKTPWDIVDIAAAVLSVKDFLEKPSFTTGALATVDVLAAVAPVIPAPGSFRHGAKLLDKVGDVLDFGKGADKLADAAKTAENVWEGLKDQQKLGVDEALQKAVDYLGEGYKEVAPGVYRSADGTRQVRMTKSDLSDKRGAHLNFEKGKTVTDPKGRQRFKQDDDGNKHIFINE